MAHQETCGDSIIETVYDLTQTVDVAHGAQRKEQRAGIRLVNGADERFGWCAPTEVHDAISGFGE